MAKIPSTTRAWAHGLIAAAIGAASTAGSTMAVEPQDFNLSHSGLIALGKVMAVSALMASFAYLKQSPLPSESVTTTVSATVTESKVKE